MSTPNALVVLLAGHVVAQLRRTRAGALRLTYEQDARDTAGTPLSLSLPATLGTFVGKPVETFLWGLLPDSDRALRAIAALHGADPRNPLSLLAAVGKDCAGAIQFCLPDDVDETAGRQGSLHPVSDADIEMRLAELRTDEDAGWVMPGEHWSLGGSQQKFALRSTADGWCEARGAAATSHIVKPGVYRMTAQALLEHVSMRAASACGVDTAATEYLSFKSESAIVVTRFDRSAAGDDLVRLHQEDLCQSLGVAEKYEELGGPTATDLIRLLRDRSRTAAEAEVNVERFVDALVLNTVIAAPDAHARNYAVLLDGDSVRLAPAYDVASGLAYEPRPGTGRVLSMSIAGELDATAVTRDGWNRFADENRLDPHSVLDRVRHYAEVVPGAMQAALDEADDWDGAAPELAARLLPAVRSHVDAVARTVG